MGFLKNLRKCSTTDCCPLICPDVPALDLNIDGAIGCGCTNGGEGVIADFSASLDGDYTLTGGGGAWGISGVGSWTAAYYSGDDCSYDTPLDMGWPTSGTFSISIYCGYDSGSGTTGLIVNAVANGLFGGDGLTWFCDYAASYALPSSTSSTIAHCGGIGPGYPMGGGTATISLPAGLKKAIKKIILKHLQAQKNLACVHRGKELRQMPCTTCPGSIKAKIFKCSIHKECSMFTKNVGVKQCIGCKEIKKPKKKKP